MSSEAVFTIPKPVGMVEERAILVNEWVDGRSLTNLMRDWRVAGRDVANAVEKVGGWLKAFHNSQLLPPAPIDTIWATEMLEDAWAAAPESFRCSQYVEKGIALLQDKRQRVNEIDVPVSWVHGDFKSDNIMMAGSRVVGLDTSANYENTILLDVSHFLNHLDLSLLDPRAIRLLPRRQALIDRFKIGCGGFTKSIEFCSVWFRLLAAIRL